MKTPTLLFTNVYDFALKWMHNGWLFFSILLIASFAMAVYNQVRKRQLRNEKLDAETLLTEKMELLKYSFANEQRIREEASKINDSKKELLAKISHEIRTPMNVIWGMASLLNETKLTSEQKEYLQTLATSSDGLLRVINDILLTDVLQYSKIESGKELESKHFNLRNTIEEVLQIFAPKATQSKLDLLCSIDTSIPSMIVGDAMRLRQILMNLVENAFRFTTTGEIVIKVQIAERNLNGLMLEFEVSDSGIGMDYERLKAVAMDLIQPSAEINPACIGVTLTICKKLVNLMGGVIEVESEENNGSVFRFTIYTGKSEMNTKKEKINIAFPGKKALIVDDNLTSLMLLKNQLQLWKVEVHSASSGEEALRILNANQDFDVVLTDENMPGMNGIELATHSREIISGLPIVLLQSNHASKDKYAQLFDAFIAKPMKLQLLTEVLSKIFNVSQAVNKHSETTMSAEFAARFPLNILIAEDDAMNQQMLKMVLKKLGYEASIAQNGKEVLEMVSHRIYDIILMDIQMPQMDGLEASRMIRLCLETQPVIIAMTANTQQGDREQCLEAGMNDYLSKPVNLAELMNSLEEWSVKEINKNAVSMRA